MIKFLLSGSNSFVLRSNCKKQRSNLANETPKSLIKSMANQIFNLINTKGIQNNNNNYYKSNTSFSYFISKLSIFVLFGFGILIFNIFYIQSIGLEIGGEILVSSCYLFIKTKLNNCFNFNSKRYASSKAKKIAKATKAVKEIPVAVSSE